MRSRGGAARLLCVAAGGSERPATAKTRRATPSAAPIILFVLVVATLGWFISRQVRGERAGRQMLVARQAARQQLAAARRSSQNLPPIVELPVDQVLLVKPIAGHPCGRNYKWQIPGNSAFVPYSASYKRSETSADYEVSFADVNVRLYPNSDWAVFATKEGINGSSETEDPASVTSVTKFGNKVVMNTSMRYPNGGGDLYFYWASHNRFVQVTFHDAEEDEFLEEYLALYPSTL
jgi:hypothetical protein